MRSDASGRDCLHAHGFGALDQDASLRHAAGIEGAPSDAPLLLRRAERWAERATGLLVGPRLKAGHGLWILRCRAIHTIGMRYPIAVFFLDDCDRVTSAIGRVKPGSWLRDRVAVSVVETHEVQAGSLCSAVLRVESSVRLARGQLSA
ncbi:MAG: DUF192 domain-containing protein [Burkholderiales bacterium]